jgi:exodeoxyribonuclease VII small subunit
MYMNKQLSFEEGMADLERLVDELESGELPLDKCFAAYEKGVALVKVLKGMLSDGEARIVALKADLDGISMTDIAAEVSQ